MSKKIKYIVAAVLAAVVCVAVIFTINRKKSGINMNVGELSGDEQNYWNPDIHSISKAENQDIITCIMTKGHFSEIF